MLETPAFSQITAAMVANKIGAVIRKIAKKNSGVIISENILLHAPFYNRSDLFFAQLLFRTLNDKSLTILG